MIREHPPSWTCIEGDHIECVSAKCGCGCHPYGYVLPEPDDKPYETYRDYLKHPRFLAVRSQVFNRAGGVCEQCQKRQATEPHHLHYPPWGAFDVPENLLAVCHSCHCEIHGKES